MKLPILSFYSALILAAFGVVSAIGQIPPKPTEVQRLTEENQLLRQQLAEAQGKAQSKAVATKSVSSKTDARVIVSEKAQTESGSATTFLDKIFLRKSVFDENALAPGQITDPAQFTYVHPGHGKDTYSIDTGLAATFITPQPGAWQVDWGIGADYHRNSDVSSVKDLFQAGFIADAIFGNAAEGDFVRLKANVSYRDDNVKNLQAVAAGFDVLPIVAVFRIDNFHRFGPAHWRWQPFAGLRYEDSIDEGPGTQQGHRLAARYGVEMQVFPLFDYVKRSVEATARYTMWSDLDSSGTYHGKRWSGYLDAGVTYWFHGGASLHKEKMDLGVGVSYQNGDNPELDITNADLLTVSLKAKF